MAAKLNNEANAYLLNRRQQSRFSNEFSIIFLGDSHVGEQQCGSQHRPLDRFERILRNIVANEQKYHNVLCIVHGGDGTDAGGTNLKAFKDRARQVLYDEHHINKIPFFMNVGNHEYTGGNNASIYSEYIGNPDNVTEITLLPQHVRVLLMNTGPHVDGFYTTKDWQHQITRLKYYIDKAPSNVKFIIDMHIPPRLGPHAAPGVTHSLNKPFNNDFVSFLQKYYKRIIAIVSHHRHCYGANSANPWYYNASTPLYLTAWGGQCDYARKICNNQQYPYQYLKLTFHVAGNSAFLSKHSFVYVS